MATTRRVTLDNEDQHHLASLGRRLGARIIDGILVTVVSFNLGWVGVGIVSLDAISFEGVIGLIIIFSLVILLYEVTMIALRGQTVGKMMMGIKVIRAVDGQIPGWGKSAKRWLVPQLPGLIPFVGSLLTLLVYLSPVFDNRRQGWHDKAAGTFVVRDRGSVDYPDSEHPQPPTRAFTTPTSWNSTDSSVMSDAGIHLEGITKTFGEVVAVDDVDIVIREGEFFSLLGPSGCGKTTSLRMIAGFEVPDKGRVLLRDKDVSGDLPSKRNVNMVFQHYALFPHMNVEDNVMFGLRVSGVRKKERVQRVAEILEIVRLPGFQKRKPFQLSGGQQQRVALARALVNRPSALLLDEPLGALDVKLRREMQLELKAIQHDLGTTFVYVTHDQEEALTMSDRIAVMNLGRVEQTGTPREIYENPESSFVAGFIGSLNAMDLTVEQRPEGTGVMSVGEGRVMARVGASVHVGTAVRAAVRPERVALGPPNAPVHPDGSVVFGTVGEVIYLGAVSLFHLDIPGLGQLVSQRMSHEEESAFQAGDPVSASWEPAHTLILELNPDA